MLRPEDEDTFLIIRHPQEPCIVAIPITRWEAKVKRLQELEGDTTVLKAFLRRLLYGATEQTLDKQGRLNLTKDLIEYAELDTNVLLFPNSDQIEIWNPKNYEERFVKREFTERDHYLLNHTGL